MSVREALRRARADAREEGPLRFWLGWGGPPPGAARRAPGALRAAALERGRFTPAARRVLAGYRFLRVPTGVAWTAAFLALLVPRWLPRAGALPRTPWIGAACLHPLPLIAGVEAALTPEVVAHELAHVLWPRLPVGLRREFRARLAAAEARDPALRQWLDAALAGYKDPRSPDECHVRVLEYYAYGRRPVPAELWEFYRGWIEEPHCASTALDP